MPHGISHHNIYRKIPWDLTEYHEADGLLWKSRGIPCTFAVPPVTTHWSPAGSHGIPRDPMKIVTETHEKHIMYIEAYKGCIHYDRGKFAQ